jgi:methionine-rich copper-binding protein CopC
VNARGTATRAALLVLVTAGALLLPSGQAWAHAQLEGSTPAEGSVWSSAPPTAQLVFSSAVDPAQVEVSVAAPDGTTGTVRATVQDKRVTVPLLTSRTAGAYAVRYRVMSWDGHRAEGRVRFSVQAASGSGTAPVALSSPASPSQTPPGSSVADLWPVIVAVLATIVIAWTLVTRRGARPA